MQLSLPAAIMFSIYLLVMPGIGVRVYQRNKSLSDFVLGGRSPGSWIALEQVASDMSGWCARISTRIVKRGAS